MSGYSEMYKDMQHRKLLEQWAPAGGYPSEWDETTRFHYARAQAAEHDLRQLKAAINTLVKAVS